jgi:outer membrane protein, multidrug efflux system
VTPRAALVCPLLAALASGCALGPNYRRPDITPPPAYRDVTAPEARSLADAQWFELFAEPALNALIKEALDNNLDLRFAVARVEEFRARAGLARAQLGPTVDGVFQTSATPKPDLDNSYLAGLVFNWEIDFFGRLRRGSEAARADLLASVGSARATMASLVSDVTQTWFTLRTLDEQAAIARRTIAAQEESLELVRTLMRGGLASGAEESQAINQLATTRAQLPRIERQQVQAENLLSVLLGRPPQAVQRAPLPEEFPVPPQIPVGLPSTLLERRPDIAAAEASLHAATARVGVAQANRIGIPLIGLTGTLGMVSTALTDLFTGDDTGEPLSAFGPFASALVVDSGRGKRGVEIARAQVTQAELAWRNTVLLSLREVADVLITLDRLREEIAQNEIRMTAAREYLRLTDLRFRGGVTSYLEVLDAQRQLFSAEIDLAESRRTVLLGYVELYRALGGGWSNDQLEKLGVGGDTR